METAEIRRRWLAFFETKGHTVVPSASLLYDDPNLLFVGAGMVPFVPYFVGQETPPWPRAISSCAIPTAGGTLPPPSHVTKAKRVISRVTRDDMADQLAE